MSSKATALKSLRNGLLLALLVIVASLGPYVLNVVLRNNFQTVSPGKVYRSAQMSSNALARVIHDRGIKTVVNLRGYTLADWYFAETNITHELGVKQVDFNMSALREFTDAEMDVIVAAIATAPKPVLIHCQAGSDRTGLVSALYLYSCEGQTAKAANGQLSVLYGHVSYFGNGTIAMDRSFWRYVSNHVQSSATDRSAAPPGRTNAAIAARDDGSTGR